MCGEQEARIVRPEETRDVARVGTRGHAPYPVTARRKSNQGSSPNTSPLRRRSRSNSPGARSTTEHTTRSKRAGPSRVCQSRCASRCASSLNPSASRAVSTSRSLSPITRPRSRSSSLEQRENSTVRRFPTETDGRLDGATNFGRPLDWSRSSKFSFFAEGNQSREATQLRGGTRLEPRRICARAPRRGAGAARRPPREPHQR